MTKYEITAEDLKKITENVELLTSTLIASTINVNDFKQIIKRLNEIKNICEEVSKEK